MEYSFILPLGIENEDGELFKKGKMRLATALDEIEIQGGEKNHIDPRYRDLEMLSKTIVSIEGIGKVTATQLEDLYEVDFIYLQMFFNELNGDSDKLTVSCPNCGSKKDIKITDLYNDQFNKEESYVGV